MGRGLGPGMHPVHTPGGPGGPGGPAGPGGPENPRAPCGPKAYKVCFFYFNFLGCIHNFSREMIGVIHHWCLGATANPSHKRIQTMP